MHDVTFSAATADMLKGSKDCCGASKPWPTLIPQSQLQSGRQNHISDLSFTGRRRTMDSSMQPNSARDHLLDEPNGLGSPGAEGPGRDGIHSDAVLPSCLVCQHARVALQRCLGTAHAPAIACTAPGRYA